MFDHRDLAAMRAAQPRMRSHIRRKTFSPTGAKTLRRFLSCKVAEMIVAADQSTFPGKRAADPAPPAGELEPEGGQALVQPRRGERAARANFKGRADKSTDVPPDDACDLILCDRASRNRAPVDERGLRRRSALRPRRPRLLGVRPDLGPLAGALANLAGTSPTAKVPTRKAFPCC
ncbi:hypothetical protein [Rubrimonas sp.]|uniref:hypothetical protein n=1 Tax=Rubrimonas sp. TaxID=2036015 RepID=UPI002FDD98FE